MLLLLGLGIRLLDLTDPPLDIHPTRQLHSALMARGMYYRVSTERIRGLEGYNSYTTVETGGSDRTSGHGNPDSLSI